MHFFSNRQSKISPLTPYLPLPKYFGSEWSYAQYSIPAQSAHISLTAPPSRPSTADVVDEEKCVVGWIRGLVDPQEDGSQPQSTEFQLIALTYTGGWYRLSLPSPNAPSNISGRTSPLGAPISTSPPSVRALSTTHRPRSSSGSSFSGKPDKGKEKEREKEGGQSRDCTLKEFRRYGRWDGWG